VLFRKNRVGTQVQTYRAIKVTDLVWFSLTRYFFWTHDCYKQQKRNIYCLVTFSTSHQIIIYLCSLVPKLCMRFLPVKILM